MKIFHLFWLLLLPLFAFAQKPFVGVWKTNKSKIEIYLEGIYAYSWENINEPDMTGEGSGVDVLHLDLPKEGEYRIQLTPIGAVPLHRLYPKQVEKKRVEGIKKIKRSEWEKQEEEKNWISFYFPLEVQLMAIEQWGDVCWSTMKDAFKGDNSLRIIATDYPDLSQVRDMSYMFSGIKHNRSISFEASIAHWEVGNVVNMEGLFKNTSNFNQPLTYWDVSQVTNMSYMFAEAKGFNQPLDHWDVSRVTSMEGMFSRSNFNQPIGNWQVNQVVNMKRMFFYTVAFNQPLDTWKLESLTQLDGMFQWAKAFNQPLNNWNVSQVTSMNNLFEGTSNFNQPLDH